MLIVAAYAAVRAGLQALLAEEPDLEIVCQAAGSAELERALAQTLPDVVLFDHQPAEAARVLELTAAAEAGLVVLGEERTGLRALAEAPVRGWGFLLKEAGGPEIAAAVRAAASGLSALDRSVAAGLAAAGLAAAQADLSDLDPDEPILTSREREVLQLMAQGLPNKAIAGRLGVSQHTAKFHVASILAKLNAASRTEAVTVGARRGLIAL